MLAPDPTPAQQQLTQHVDAATVVTQYAQAVQTLVPAYEDAVTDAGVRAAIDGAQRHAQTWTSGLCASCAETVPNLFVDFAGAFEAQEEAMAADVRTLLADPSDHTARDDLAARLNALSVALAERGGSATAVRRDLQTFQGTVQADHDAIAAALAALQATGEGSILVQQAQATLGLSFLQPQQLSPCVAIVQIDEQVSINLTAVAGGPEAATSSPPPWSRRCSTRCAPTTRRPARRCRTSPTPGRSSLTSTPRPPRTSPAPRAPASPPYCRRSTSRRRPPPGTSWPSSPAR